MQFGRMMLVMSVAMIVAVVTVIVVVMPVRVHVVLRMDDTFQAVWHGRKMEGEVDEIGDEYQQRHHGGASGRRSQMIA
ncbi:MAG: hypothetical protein CMO80_04965 [Verrucomicrobiales bacterium]|nr:hypothetical protein [Verrucomicrobiales bacterium]|tara:strand:+ start:1660 stop:1893 length:234 start_codon:yes stop_codon:yes gene_type:complete